LTKADIRRGEVVNVRPRASVGHEQRGTRPAIVVQADSAWWLKTVVVVPTSTSAQPAECRPEITVGGRRTRALLEQITTVDRARLGRSRGHLAAADLREVEDALRLVVGFL
jgi:mRNA interferase MazF